MNVAIKNLVPSLSERGLSESGLSVPLSALRVGEHAVVTRMGSECRLQQRLSALGFVTGTPVLVRRRAPMGDPFEYELRGYRVILRKGDADQIFVSRDE